MKNKPVAHTPGLTCKLGPLGTWCYCCKSLIAAAPELLLAVKGYAQYLKIDGRESKELQALIAKAEGR